MEFDDKKLDNRIYDVNLSALFVYLMKKWYLIISSGIVLTILFTMLVGYCRRSLAQEAFNPSVEMEISDENEVEFVENLLGEDSLREIAVCMDRVDRMGEMKTYLTDSVLMQLDPYECKRLTVVYEATSENLASLRNLTSQYVSFATSDERFSNSISEAVGDSEHKYHISDVITAGEESAISQTDYNIIRVDFIVDLLPEWDEEAVINAIKTVLESYEIPSRIDDYEVSFHFLKATSIIKYCPDIKANQTNIFGLYNTDAAYLNAAIENLDRPSALLFNYYLKQKGLENDYKALILEPTPSELLELEESRGATGKIADISYVKAAIIGFFGGAFLMVGLMVLIVLLRGKAGRILGISVMSDKVLYGILSSNKGKRGCETRILETSDSIKYCLDGSDCKKVCLAYFGKMDENGLKSINDLCDRIKNTSDIKPNVIGISLNDPDRYCKLSEIDDPVILCITYGKNSIKEINLVDQLLHNGNKQIIGSVGIE